MDRTEVDDLVNYKISKIAAIKTLKYHRLHSRSTNKIHLSVT